MSEYERLVDLTHRTLGRRTRVYRWLVVGLVGLTVAVLGTAVAAGRVEYLGLWLGGVPLVAAFLVLDGRIVSKWSESVLEAWADERVEIGPFAGLLAQVPGLPEDTIEGMLTTIAAAPRRSDLADLPRESRRALASAVVCLERARTLRVGGFGLASLWGVASIIAAVGARSWLPLTSLVVIPAIAWATRRVVMRRLRRCGRGLREQVSAETGREELRGLLNDASRRHLVADLFRTLEGA